MEHSSNSLVHILYWTTKNNIFVNVLSQPNVSYALVLTFGTKWKKLKYKLSQKTTYDKLQNVTENKIYFKLKKIKNLLKWKLNLHTNMCQIENQSWFMILKTLKNFDNR